MNFKDDLNHFAGMVIEDIQKFGTIPMRTIRALARCNRLTDKKVAEKELLAILMWLRDLRGDDYLEIVRKQVASEAILVTIEKQ
jgi:hypothetical protein